MNVLHMDVDTVQVVHAKIVQHKEAMTDSLAQSANQMSTLIGSGWIGNSANEFQELFKQLRYQMLMQLGLLDTLAQSLQTEIQQWIEMAARMG